ncbi:hypothetical protein F4818DRAFT_309184 [Hypoxylon cercidicola]|nr:hypothetical protein F4818DRAFT_309184 [Hypoxylon cercidicola]
MATATPHARSSLRRTACDRCRHSKLRCFRDENQQKCARCLRLELHCEVAPAKPPGRPRKVVSPPTPVGEPTDHVDIPSPQLSDQGRSSFEDPNGEPSVQSPEELLSGSDNQQVNTIIGQKPMPSHSNVNDWTLTSVPPPSDFRIPEWYEMVCFDAGLPPSRDPLEVHSLFTVRLDRHECIRELSQLNVDLHVQNQALRELIDTGRIKFSTFIDHLPPPAGDGVSLAEKLLIMSQRFQQAITNLGWVVKNEPKPPRATAPVAIDDEFAVDPLLNASSAPIELADGGEYVTEQDGQLETPFVFLLVSCYVQMINLWEIMYFHVHRRILGVDRDQLTLSDPGKGIQMGAFYIFSGRMQSMFFCQAVLYFIENIDRGLGILPEQREQDVSGLLGHPQNFDLLQRELGGQVHEGVNERICALRDSVERARICSLHDVGW